jgi:hypothetical protein
MRKRSHCERGVGLIKVIIIQKFASVAAVKASKKGREELPQTLISEYK